MKFNSKYLAVIVLLALLSDIQVYGQKKDKVYSQFIENDSSYTFTGRFKVKAQASCILDICFKKEHIEALADEAKTVTQLKSGENWNQLSYTYKKLGVFVNKTVWIRIIQPEKNRVSFKLLLSKNSHDVMPEILSSSGHYKVTELCDGYLQVEYLQKCTLSNVPFTKMQIKMVKKGAIDFTYRLRDYITQNCRVMHAMKGK